MSKLRGMANTRKRAPARTTGRKGTARRGRGRGFSWPTLGLPTRLPELDQRQRDVIGLALLALGIFMGFVLWGRWNGGGAGHGLAVGLGWVVGKARVLAPIALIGGGSAMLLRPVWPALRPLRTGAICLSASIVLALAAGTLGVSSGVGR